MPSPSSDKAPNYKHRGKVYPTLGFVLAANRKALTVTPQDPRTRNLVLKPEIVESAVNAPIESAFGEDAYPRFFDKVAALTYRIITGHAFVDGNKRTALLVAETTLLWNQYYLKASDETLVLVMLLTASGNLDIQGLRTALLYMCGLDPAANPNL